MLRFCSLASGSAGNATLVEASDGTHRTRLLIDCGLGRRQLDVRLAACGLSVAELDGIFITHEHGDHIGCALSVAARARIPLWMSAGTQRALPPAALAGLTIHRAADGEALAMGALQLRPFTVPHDALEPLQLTCTDGQRSFGLLTDLGHVSAHALANLAGVHALMLESNHDSELLSRSAYPPFLKQRIAGRHGHLSNAQAAEALALLRHPGLNLVIAAHLSERNNSPAHAQASLAPVLNCASADVLLASRHGLGWLTV